MAVVNRQVVSTGSINEGTKHRVGPLGGARLDVAMATNQRAAPLLLSLLSLTDAWRHCEFIHTKWFAHDELPGISFVYALAAMNGKTYAAGYARGSFGLTGHTRGGAVPPDPTSAFFGDAQSQLQVCQLGLPHAYSPPPASACAVAQSIFISETDATTAKTERGWYMIGAAFPDSEGGGAQSARPLASAGIKAMLDKRHLAVAGDFGALLTLPDGTTQWSSAIPPRQNTNDAVHFVMKLDVTTANGVGPGTSGWARKMDEDFVGNLRYPGGVTVRSVDGDEDGNMYVSYEGCTSYNATGIGQDAWGRPSLGLKEGCTARLAKLWAVNGSEAWEVDAPPRRATQLTPAHCVPRACGLCEAALTTVRRDVTRRSRRPSTCKCAARSRMAPCTADGRCHPLSALLTLAMVSRWRATTRPWAASSNLTPTARPSGRLQL